VAQTISPARPQVGVGGDWRAASRALGLVARVAIPLAALWLEGVPGLLGALVAQEAGLWLARRVATEPALGGALYLGAFALRALVAIPLHAVEKARNGSGAVFQDDATYDLVGAWLVRIGHGDGIAIFPGHKHLLDSLYPYLLAGVYALLGYTPLVPKLLNAAASALCAVLVMEIARRAFRPTVGLVAGVAFALLPSLVLYSSVALKEPLLLLGVLVALRAIQELGQAPLRSGAFGNAAVVLAAALLLVGDLRAPLVVLLGALALVTVLRRGRRRVSRAQSGLALLALVAIGASAVVAVRVRAPESAFAQATHLDYVAVQLQHRRAWEALRARSQIEPVTSPSTAIDASDNDTLSLGDVLPPLGFALLSPAPWQAHGLRELAASGEMLVWYALLAAALFTTRARPQQPWFLVCLLVYGLATWAALAASEGNLGNLLRHRVMLTPTLLVLGSGGLVWLTRWKVEGGRWKKMANFHPLLPPSTFHLPPRH
jgi:hypothetical protein